MSLFASSTDPLRPHGFRPDVTTLLLGALAINILSLALPIMTLQVYDRILPNPGSGTLPVLITGVCLALFLEFILRLSRAYMLGWGGASFEHRLTCNAVSHILNSDLSRLGRSGTGEHLLRMDSIGKLKDFYNGYSLVTICELAFVPLFLGLVIYIAGPLAAVPATVLMVFTLVSLAFGQNLRGALKERDRADDRRYDFLITALESIHSLKAFALENKIGRDYEALEQHSTRANYNVTEATSGVFNASNIFSHIMIVSVIAVGAVFALQGMLTTGALIATVLLSGRMMQPVQRALALWTRYQDYTLAREKVEDIFTAPLHSPVINDNEVLREGVLQLDHVCYTPRQDGAPLFKNINLNVARGDIVLLSGAHGTGKTALLELIAGIYPAHDGAIEVDGRNVMQYAPTELIKHVGYVEREGTIFQGTIRDNITCFGQIPEAGARELARLLSVDTDVGRLPSGFDTLMNGHGVQSISPGLRQRIAIVRSLAQKPRLILFDGADRALDRKGYHQVYNLLARLKGKATMILVSNDQNIQGLATRFVELKDGKLSEQGGPAQNCIIHPYRELTI